MNTDLSIETLKVGYLGANCYIIYSSKSKEAYIIDPGGDTSLIAEKIKELSVVPLGIIITHGHYDHIAANSELKKIFNIPVYVHKDDAEFLVNSSLNGSAFFGEDVKFPAAERLLEDGAVIKNKDFELKIIHTPGHTPGGICILIGENLFTGDTLFKGSVGRSDLPGGNEKLMKESLRKLRGLSKSIKIFPGHGSQSTIGEEMKSNPYLE